MIFLSFILGVILGIILSLTLYIYGAKVDVPLFKQAVKILHPQEKGAVFLPPTDEEEAKDNIRKRNAERGEPTHISEL